MSKHFVLIVARRAGGVDTLDDPHQSLLEEIFHLGSRQFPGVLYFSQHFDDNAGSMFNNIFQELLWRVRTEAFSSFLRRRGLKQVPAGD